MIFRSLLCALALFAVTAAAPSAPAMHAASAPSLPGIGGPPSIPYAALVRAAKPQHGLFTIWRYHGSVMFELAPQQFGVDYAELSVPVNGIGAGIFSGITDLAPVRAIRFVHQDDHVAILFPSTRFLADPGSPVANAVAEASAPSVVGVARVISTDPKTGDVVFDASSLLGDVTDVADALTDVDGGIHNPLGAYRLNPMSSYFGPTKAFPRNVVVNVEQTFQAMQPSAKVLSVSPDARSLQIQVQYNIAALPHDDGYMPRLYDSRVGYFANAHQDFSNDNSLDDGRYYIVRWNVQKKDPTAAVSPAKDPIVYYLSNTIPAQYRAPIRAALLTWNRAFAPLGITNVVEVKDEPNDPSFDPDDIRYNVVRWLTEMQGGFAEAQLLYDPYTGEMIKSGIVVDSDLMRYGKFDYPVLVAPRAAAARPEPEDGVAYANSEKLNYDYGSIALRLSSSDGYRVPQKFADEFLRSIVLHESGHDFGLRHNFIGSQAYSARQLQSAAFTARNGVASSVMEYSPINLWPKGKSHGAYFQTVLGPYDYYAIHWGYAPVVGARTPDAELPTLRHWASVWSNPAYRYLSDEDVSWSDGAGIDPRNQQWDLTSDNIAWCQTQMGMAHAMLGRVDRRFPRNQLAFDDLRSAFHTLVGQYGRCASIVSRYVGGEYVSRALRGDPHARLPLTAIPLATQKRAFGVLQRDVFAASAWNFSPRLLRQLVTQYRYDDWIGSLPLRHDVAVETLVSSLQRSIIGRMYSPVTLQRLDDMDLKYRPGTTMDLGDLFAWMQTTVLGDVRSGKSIGLLRRDLQRTYAARLSQLANKPLPGTPGDAQALARQSLRALGNAIVAALNGGVPDAMTRAHLEAMGDDVQRALTAHYEIPLPT